MQPTEDPSNPRGQAPARRKLCLIAALAVAALAAVGCGSGDGAESGLNGITRTPPSEVGDLSLPDVSPDGGGRETELRASRDELRLVYFGYTSCPDVCPTTLADLRLALGEMDESEARRIRVGMITVDPERDTARVLNGYLGHFFEPGRYDSFRTTDEEQLAEVEEAFHASHELGKPDREGNYDVGHTAQVYAVDADGEVVVEWGFGTPPEQIRSDLQQLLGESAPQS